jgi:hypothetical protein
VDHEFVLSLHIFIDDSPSRQLLVESVDLISAASGAEAVTLIVTEVGVFGFEESGGAVLTGD